MVCTEQAAELVIASTSTPMMAVAVSELSMVITRVVVLVDLGSAEETAEAIGINAGTEVLPMIAGAAVLSMIGATVTVLFTWAIVWTVSSA